MNTTKNVLSWTHFGTLEHRIMKFDPKYPEMMKIVVK